MQLLSKNENRYEAVILSKQESYSNRLPWMRVAVYATKRVVGSLQRCGIIKVLLGPKKDKPYDPWFMFLGEELPGGKSSEAAFARTTFLNEKEEKAAINSAYQCPFEFIDPKIRVDYEYHRKVNRDIADTLKDSPTVEGVAEFMVGGIHSKQSSLSDHDSLEDEKVNLEERTLFTRAHLIGLNDITLSGGLKGRFKAVHIEQPSVAPLRAGDLIVSLFGGHMWRKEIGSIGKAAIYEGNSKDVYVNQTMAIIRPDVKKVNPYFLLMSLSANYFREQLLCRMKPGNRQQAMVSLSDLKECRIKLLPIDEMQEIGERHRRRIEIEKATNVEYKEDMAKINLGE